MLQTVGVSLIFNILTEQIWSKNVGSIRKSQTAVFQIWVKFKSACSSVCRIYHEQ